MIVSRVVASPFLIFFQLVNLLLLLGRSSRSKDVELLVLGHAVAVGCGSSEVNTEGCVTCGFARVLIA
jgi:hypothetical protein